MPNQVTNLDALWTSKAAKVLLNRKIVSVRYMQPSEAQHLGWDERTVVIQLDNGTLIWPSRDDEGNGGGALFTTDDNEPTLPVL